MEALSSIQPQDSPIKITAFCGMYPIQNLTPLELTKSAQDILSCIKTGQDIFHYWRPSLAALIPNQDKIQIG